MIKNFPPLLMFLAILFSCAPPTVIHVPPGPIVPAFPEATGYPDKTTSTTTTFKVFASDDTGGLKLENVSIELFQVDAKGTKIPTASSATFSTNSSGYVELTTTAPYGQAYGILAQSPGRASSLLQVFYPSTLEGRDVKLILSKIQSATRSVNPAKIELAEDLAFNEYSSSHIVNISLNIEVQTENPLFPVDDALPISIGIYGTNSTLVASNSNLTSFSPTIASSQVPYGHQILITNVFDSNFNQTQLYTPIAQLYRPLIQITNRPGESSAKAITVKAETESRDYSGSIFPFSLTSDESRIFVTLSVPASSYDGVAAFRSNNPSDTPQFIGVRDKDFFSSVVGYLDTSPSLVAGQTYYYVLSYFKKDSNGFRIYGAQSEPVPVTILPESSHLLSSPLQNTALAAKTDNYSFTFTDSVASDLLPASAQRFDSLKITEILDGLIVVAYTSPPRSATVDKLNNTFIVPAANLQTNHYYTWDVVSYWSYQTKAQQQNLNYTTTSVSFTQASSGQYQSTSTADNGAYTLLITP